MKVVVSRSSKWVIGINWRIFFTAILSLQGCGTILSASIIESRDSTILFSELLRAPENYIGKVLILGGTIISFQSGPKGGLLNILQRPLSDALKPQMGDQTQGRFLVQSEKALDIDEFSKGRRITLAGEVIGKKIQTIDQMQYGYPLLNLKEYYLWSNRLMTPNIQMGIGYSGSF